MRRMMHSAIGAHSTHGALRRCADSAQGVIGGCVTHALPEITAHARPGNGAQGPRDPNPGRATITRSEPMNLAEAVLVAAVIAPAVPILLDLWRQRRGHSIRRPGR